MAEDMLSGLYIDNRFKTGDGRLGCVAAADDIKRAWPTTTAGSHARAISKPLR